MEVNRESRGNLLFLQGVDRSALAARELEWLEKEENRIREQNARILAQSQR
jgi:hypothetical protein